MTIEANFYSAQFSDGLLTVTMAPPTNITNWTIWYREYRQPGGGQPLILASGQNSGVLDVNLIEKWIGSGYTANQSGGVILDTVNGQFRFVFPPNEVSGREAGAYPYIVQRVDSGYFQELAAGYRIITRD